MRRYKDLLKMLDGLVTLLAEETDRNPRFGDRLDALLAPLPSRKPAAAHQKRKCAPQNLPDIHAEFNSRGESEFRLWLRGQPIPTLRALVRVHDLDAARRTGKWKEPEKLADFITDQVRSRLSRGSAFLFPPGSKES